MKLDRIPRYGRHYVLKGTDPETLDLIVGPTVWSWHKYGYWGLNLLDDLGLMWAYIDTTSPWEEEEKET
jgi:hypothetical protein